MSSLVMPGIQASAWDNWTGVWDTNYGKMVLRQDGNHVSGTYEYEGGSRVEGTVTDNVFNGTWYEPSSSGALKFTMSDDGMAFKGFWNGNNTWNGTKRPTLNANQTYDWTGVWDTNYGKMVLRQDGNHVSGTYEYNGGSRVEGTVTDNVFYGTWYEPGSSGALKFTIFEDGMAFSGFWNGNNTWNGTRQR